MPMTEFQELQQTYGPHRPTVIRLVQLLSKIPSHHEIQSIAINGQTGEVWIEYWHEGMQGVKKFRANMGAD